MVVWFLKSILVLFLLPGLVGCYVALGKIMEATTTAKEALALMPLSARAVCLAGRVMMENNSLHNKVNEIKASIFLLTLPFCRRESTLKRR